LFAKRVTHTRDGYSILVYLITGLKISGKINTALTLEPHSCQYIHELAMPRGFSILSGQTKFMSKPLHCNVIMPSILIDYHRF